ncbi:hypothetical protein J437_LFUL006247 [Ladona fulva]|uniref:Uncharacterized protein n=1 Tax=Ladona fulva TaxID=123851 RepID=A0A8K0K4M0_LADFU|nr:hypothetical protein J437_LFUL006247 [Ladona fulva]
MDLHDPKIIPGDTGNGEEATQLSSDGPMQMTHPEGASGQEMAAMASAGIEHYYRVAGLAAAAAAAAAAANVPCAVPQPPASPTATQLHQHFFLQHHQMNHAATHLQCRWPHGRIF